MSSINIFYGSRKNFTTVEAAFYSSLHRALWSVGTGWVLLACITDNSGKNNYSKNNFKINTGIQRIVALIIPILKF